MDFGSSCSLYKKSGKTDFGFWILDRQKWILDRVADFVWLLKYTTVLHLQEIQRLLLQTQLMLQEMV